MGQVVVEHLPVVVARVVLANLFSALAGAIDKVATARPATNSSEAFMAIFSQGLGQQMLIPERMVASSRFKFQDTPKVNLGRRGLKQASPPEEPIEGRTFGE